MWFRNLQIYRIAKTFVIDAETACNELAKFALQPCGTSDMQSIGWVPPRHVSLIHSVNRQWLLALGVEKKLLPAAVVKQFASEKAKAIEEAEGRRVGRKEMRDLREAAMAELLPRAFVRRSTTFGWIDPVNGWLVVDAASAPKAEQFLEHLRKSIDHFPAKLFRVNTSPSYTMTTWVNDWSKGHESPEMFTIDNDLTLASDEHAQVRYVKHSLESEYVSDQICEGKVATKLALTWADRISFVLTDDLQIKRLSFLDILKEQADGQTENEDERFDIDFTLMTGEVARLLADLTSALGGEVVSE